MSFGFIGASGAGSGVSIFQYVTKEFDLLVPTATDFIEIWNPNNPLLPEPESAHVMLCGMVGWLNSKNENHPPNCGAPFGYKRYLKGNVPRKVYAWRGNHNTHGYPYNYDDNGTYCGFNTSASFNGAMMLPNPGSQSMFSQTDFIAADAVNHSKGDWDKVFNGGNGHYFARPGAFKNHDGPGSNASIFGSGYNGGQYPAGTGSAGTDTARGTEATHIAKGILDEFGFFKNFVKGAAPETDENKTGSDGSFTLNVPSDVFPFGMAPLSIDTSKLQLPKAVPPTDRLDSTGLTEYKITFAVILEYK